MIWLNTKLLFFYLQKKSRFNIIVYISRKRRKMDNIEGNIEIIEGDITKVQADAIVNAANSSLLGGGGVDGAIHRAGGASILLECKRIVAKQGACPTGKAVITTAGNLPAKFVIHTVGPIWSGGHQNEAHNLANCYRNTLHLAARNNCRTIAFPNISTGIYRYPKAEAATIALEITREFLANNDQIEKVYFVCFEEENAQIMRQLLRGRC